MFEVEFDTHVRYIFKSFNTKWTEYRQQLWQQRDDETHNRDGIIAMCLEEMNINHWTFFVDYNLKWTKIIKTTLLFDVLIYLYLVISLHACLGNFQKKKDNRKKKIVPHTGGSKSIAPKKDEMVT